MKISKSNNTLVNMINSLDVIKPFLESNNLKVDRIKKSNYNSIYLEIYEINNDSKFDYLPIYAIRFSDHYCCNYSNGLIMNLVSENGQFIIGKSMMYKISQNLKEIKESIHLPYALKK